MTYLRKEKIIKELINAGFGIFSTLDFTKHLKIPKRKAILFLSRAVKSGHLTRLKKDLYYITGSLPSFFSIANVLYRPSYISLDTALSYYKIIPETIYSITSITTKVPKSIIVNNQEFLYQKLNKKLYFGYKPIKVNNSYVLMAEKEKALLDYLYFIARGKRILNERINISHLNGKRLSKYYQLFKNNVNNIYFIKKFDKIVKEKLKIC